MRPGTDSWRQPSIRVTQSNKMGYFTCTKNTLNAAQLSGKAKAEQQQRWPNTTDKERRGPLRQAHQPAAQLGLPAPSRWPQPWQSQTSCKKTRYNKPSLTAAGPAHTMQNSYKLHIKPPVQSRKANQPPPLTNHNVRKALYTKLSCEVCQCAPPILLQVRRVSHPFTRGLHTYYHFHLSSKQNV